MIPQVVLYGLGIWLAKRFGGPCGLARRGWIRAQARLQRTPGGGEVITHRPDGRIRDSDTINRSDPNPPRDTRH